MTLTFKEELRRYEQDLVLKYLEEAFGNCAEAARMAGMNRFTFYGLVRKYGIDPEVFRQDRTA